MRLRPLLPLVAVLPAPLATAQSIPQLTPFSRTGDLFVTDPSSDAVLRLQDLDLDGDYDGPAEVAVFYDDTTGTIPLTNPNGIAVGTNGTVYVTDSSEDRVFAFTDLDQNGDCFGPGEASVFYDPAVSATGIVLGSSSNLSVDFVGRLWIAVAGAGTGADTVDKIVRLSDDNFDGDANDLGESIEYYIPAPGGAGGDTLPQDAQVGPDGRLYIVDIPSTGTNLKGVYLLDDVSGNGTIEPAEATPFFTPTSQPNNPFYWGFTIDADGFFYMADTFNELVWRFRDENGDDVVDEATEATVWWQSSGASLIWRVAAASDGSIYAAESQAPDRILRLVDADGNGSVDPVSETETVWSDEFGNLDIINPRTLAFGRGATIDVPDTASLGGSFNVNLFGTTGQPTIAYASAATIAPISIAPLGSFELDPTLGFTLIGTGTVPIIGPSQTGIVVPSTPTLVGATVFVQGAVGSGAALRLTNVDAITFQP